MSEYEVPKFDITPPTNEARNPVGWVILFSLLGLLFVTQLLGYFERDTKQGASFKTYSDQLRMEVVVNEAARAYGTPMPSDKSATLSKIATELRPKIQSQNQAAMIYAATQYELARPVLASDVAVLSTGNPEEKAFQGIYGKSTLTPADVDNAAKSLKTERFLDRLALAHARQKAGMPKAREGLVPKSEMWQLTGAMMAIVGGFVLGIMALCLLIVKSMSKPFPGHPTGNITLPQADGLALRASLALLAMLLLSAIELLKLHLPKGVQSILEAVLVIGATAFLYRKPITGMFAGSFAGLKDIGIRRGKAVSLIGWGVLGAVANVLIVLAMFLFGQLFSKWLPPAEHPIENELLNHPSGVVLFAIFVLASVEAPFVEEVMFRGSILPALSRVTKSPLWGAVISSCLFAIIHPTGIPAWPALAAIGGMSAFLTYRTGSLVPSMVMHAVHNFATMAIALALS